MKKYLIAWLCAIPAAAIAQQTAAPMMIEARIITGIDNSYPNRNNVMSTPVTRSMFSRMAIKAHFKEHMQKMEYTQGHLKQTTIYNRKAGTSAVLKEANGERTGFIQTEAQRVDLIVKNDSVLKERENEVYERTGYRLENIVSSGTVTHIEITKKRKRINGINCKKALVGIVYSSGEKDKINVWFTDEYKLPPGVMNTFGGPLGLSALEGIPVKYRFSTRHSFSGYEQLRSTLYEIKKIDTVKTIHDHEFEIPKTYTVKTWEQHLKENPGLNGAAVMKKGG